MSLLQTQNHGIDRQRASLSQKLLFAEIDVARLREKLDKVSEVLKDRDPELHEVLAAGALFDHGPTTQDWIQS